jgi:predicted nucleotidyltransferase
MRKLLRIMRKTATLQALFPTVRQGVLAATLMQPEKWWFLSELAEFLGTRPSSLQRELRALVEIGVLERRREGTRAYFRARKQSPIFRELRSIFEKTAGIGPSLRQLLEPFEQKIVSAFVYGSLARAEEHAASDIDLMVVGNIGLAELTPPLRAAEKRRHREINVTNYSVEEFREKTARDDHFLTSVLKKPKHFLKGAQSELEAIARQQRRPEARHVKERA